eukprot:COSAG06_NODE_221_length_19912_cov_17.460875_8_plen_143_part_00
MRHAVISNNSFVRTDGTLVWGLNHKENALMPCYFIEHFRNRVSDRRLQGSPGGFRALGFYNASNDFSGPMAVGLVYRDNYVDDGTWNIGTLHPIRIPALPDTALIQCYDFGVDRRRCHRCDPRRQYHGQLAAMRYRRTRLPR